MADITITGQQAIAANIDAAITQLISKIDNAVQGAGINTEAGAKQRAPVGTPESTHKKGYVGGRFRAGYQYQKTGVGQCQVSNAVEYGPFVELGTSKMAPRPSLVPAFMEAGQELQEELKGII